MSQVYELAGTIQRFLFRNQENGYCVCIIQTRSSSQPITATGSLPHVHPGEQVIVRGSWITHPKFGKQFQITSFSTALPTTTLGLKAYLSSGLIKGIGPVYAEKLVAHFGVDVLTIIDQDPQRLREVPGIGQVRVNKIIDAWQEQRAVAAIMVFLKDKGISTAYATKMYKKYGASTVALLQENPYRIAEDIWGIGFKTADQIADTFGIAKESIKRVRAGILHLVNQATQQGHLYVELESLREQVYQLLEFDAIVGKELVKQALHDLHEQDKIKVLTIEGKYYITLTQLYFCEKGIAQKIRTLQNYQTTLDVKIDVEKAYQSMRTAQSTSDVLLNEQQQDGIMACLQNKVTIITGGPGTGKTTLIKKLLQILDDNKIIYKLAAPTGRAAKRITESTKRYAMTMHRLLEFDVASRSFKHNEKNALNIHMLIIDEASMIDVFLGHALLRALPHYARLLLIGDVDQLPSVGAGNFLNDLIASGTIATVRLTTIFRQAQDSLIITNAHRINKGEFPINQEESTHRTDYLFMTEVDPAQLPQRLETIFKRILPAHGIAKQDAMILCPMNRGMAGTQIVNQVVQKLLNPLSDKERMTYGHTTFIVGDPVMQIRNNYDKNIFNGDMGVITAIDTVDAIITVQFQDQEIMYETNELDELVLAYAATIHKSQGSEYAAVIVPIFMQHYTLLRRNLIYTAITRAKKLCIFIGEHKALAIGIGNTHTNTRVTFLRQFLTSDLTCL